MSENKSDGSTASYYELPPSATELQHLISHRNMNAQIGEIFRACYRYGIASHSDQLRDAKKVLFYATAEVERLEATQLTAADICRAFMVPAHLVGEIGPVTPMPTPATPAYPYLAEVGEHMTAKAALREAQEDDGWIEWGGAHLMPVSGSVMVTARFRNGGEETNLADSWWWHHGFNDRDIVSYRIAKGQS